MVRAHPDPPGLPGLGIGCSGLTGILEQGGVAQLGEHLLCKQGVIGSIPFTSTNQKTEVRRQTTERAVGSDCGVALGRMLRVVGWCTANPGLYEQ
jgi:hypothetical protein